MSKIRHLYIDLKLRHTKMDASVCLNIQAAFKHNRWIGYISAYRCSFSNSMLNEIIVL